MDDTENKNNFLLKTLWILLIGTPFLFTLIYVPGFVFPGSFPRTIFLYIAVFITSGFYGCCILSSKGYHNTKWLTVAVLSYIAVLFISGLAGGHFEYAFLEHLAV